MTTITPTTSPIDQPQHIGHDTATVTPIDQPHHIGHDAAAAAPSIYRLALGSDFDRLHPRMQLRFGFSSEDRVAHIGRGVMRSIERRSRLAAPFLRFGTRRNLLFPERGLDVPFTVANYSYRDRFGRETVTWHRTFHFAATRRVFDATMIFNDERDTIVDYLGTASSGFTKASLALGCRLCSPVRLGSANGGTTSPATTESTCT